MISIVFFSERTSTNSENQSYNVSGIFLEVEKIEACFNEDFGISVQKVLGGSRGGKVMNKREEKSDALLVSLEV